MSLHDVLYENLLLCYIFLITITLQVTLGHYMNTWRYHFSNASHTTPVRAFHKMPLSLFSS